MGQWRYVCSEVYCRIALNRIPTQNGLFYVIRCGGHMFVRRHLFLVVMSFLVLSVFLTVCSTRPTDRRAKADLQQWFERQWPNSISVKEYRKIKEEGDDKTLTIYFHAQARFIKDTDGCVSTCCGDVCFDKLIDGFHWTKKGSENPRVVKKGDSFEVQGKQTYKKNNKEWTIEGL